MRELEGRGAASSHYKTHILRVPARRAASG